MTNEYEQLATACERIQTTTSAVQKHEQLLREQQTFIRKRLRNALIVSGLTVMLCISVFLIVPVAAFNDPTWSVSSTSPSNNYLFTDLGKDDIRTFAGKVTIKNNDGDNTGFTYSAELFIDGDSRGTTADESYYFSSGETRTFTFSKNADLWDGKSDFGTYNYYWKVSLTELGFPPAYSGTKSSSTRDFRATDFYEGYTIYNTITNPSDGEVFPYDDPSETFTVNIGFALPTGYNDDYEYLLDFKITVDSVIKDSQTMSDWAACDEKYDPYGIPTFLYTRKNSGSTGYIEESFVIDPSSYTVGSHIIQSKITKLNVRVSGYGGPVTLTTSNIDQHDWYRDTGNPTTFSWNTPSTNYTTYNYTANGSSYTISFDMEDDESNVEKMDIWFDDVRNKTWSNPMPGTYTIVISVTEEKLYTLYVNVTDSNGDMWDNYLYFYGVSTGTAISVDVVYPVISDQYINSVPTFLISTTDSSGLDNMSVYFNVSNQHYYDWIYTNASKNSRSDYYELNKTYWDNLSNGDFWLKLRVYDDDGNVQWRNSSYTKDTVAPQLLLLSPENRTEANPYSNLQVIPFSYIITDSNVDTFTNDLKSLTIDGESMDWSLYPKHKPLQFYEGCHTLRIRVWDKAGNTNTSYVSFYYEARLEQPVYFTFTSSIDASPISAGEYLHIYINGKECASSTATNFNKFNISVYDNFYQELYTDTDHEYEETIPIALPLRNISFQNNNNVSCTYTIYHSIHSMKMVVGAESINTMYLYDSTYHVVLSANEACETNGYIWTDAYQLFVTNATTTTVSMTINYKFVGYQTTPTTFMFYTMYANRAVDPDDFLRIYM
ncbi:MAG: hypothetical protein U9R77_08825, partial [Pseudomonadota bacterium]|nr:hypothetical protein [Pseudomonadota bacterium]